MAAIPKDVSALSERIYAAYAREHDKPQYLTRMGASSAGEECARAIWFKWRGATNDKPSGRMQRLFETGHLQETRVITDLRKAGLEVWDFDENGKQWTYTIVDGHVVAKLDGVVKGVPGAEKTPHTLEIKSSNAKGFKEIVNHGCKKAKPMHYAQMQLGLHMSGLNDALYAVICKDDESYYFERIKRDDEAIAEITARLEHVYKSEQPPIRIAEAEGDWRCKFCDSKDVCWKKAEPIQNCRMCAYAQPLPEGKWACTKLNKELTGDEQGKGCDLWVTVL